ncbi:uncharacterized protein ACRADG_007417 [Cochliomyia hominivorax]
MKTTTTTSAHSSRVDTSNSSTCSDPSSSTTTITSSSTNNLDLHLNVNTFRKYCLPLLRLCLDANEDHELTCLDSVVEGIQKEFDSDQSDELICGIFDVLYDCEVISKESFEKWYKQQRQLQAEDKNNRNRYEVKRPLSAYIEAYMQKLL